MSLKKETEKPSTTKKKLLEVGTATLWGAVTLGTPGEGA